MNNYITKHKEEWKELESLIRRAGKVRRGLRKMSPKQLSRLDILYRRVTVHLAQVASRTDDAGLIQYLNNLTAAAHSIIYSSPRYFSFRGIIRFLTRGFPMAVARTYRYHTAAALLLIAGALLGYYSVKHIPAAAYALLPEGEFRQPGATKEQLHDVLKYGREAGGGYKFFFASFLFSHNLKVALLALATGIIAAVPTILLMIYNGAILGALTSAYDRGDIFIEYWAWILPHGITELLAIILCGGIGLQLGHAVLAPGFTPRVKKIASVGREAVCIVIGIAVMLVFAAIIESYLRQSELPTSARLFFASGTFFFWALYFINGNRLAILEQQQNTV